MIHAHGGDKRPVSVQGKQRNRIPMQFKVVPSLVGGQTRCTRVSFCGTGDRRKAVSFMQLMEIVLGCSYYGGFSREGVWEAVVCFNKNKCELPYEAELERMASYLDCNVSLNILDRTVTGNVVACYYRISKLHDSFGHFPAFLSSRLVEYRRREEENRANDSVELYTGRQLDSTTHLQMHHEIQALLHQNTLYRGQIRYIEGALRFVIRTIEDAIGNPSIESLKPCCQSVLEHVRNVYSTINNDH